VHAPARILYAPAPARASGSMIQIHVPAGWLQLAFSMRQHHTHAPGRLLHTHAPVGILQALARMHQLAFSMRQLHAHSPALILHASAPAPVSRCMLQLALSWLQRLRQMTC